jgi:hypothetical protein
MVSADDQKFINTSYYLLANRNAHIHINNTTINANADGHTGMINVLI